MSRPCSPAPVKSATSPRSLYSLLRTTLAHRRAPSFYRWHPLNRTHRIPTSLLEAIYLGIHQMTKASTKRKALLVISNGGAVTGLGVTLSPV